MGNMYVYSFYPDENGDYITENVTEHLQTYSTWSEARESPIWYSGEDDQLPYVHEYWDQYHGVQDEWWFEKISGGSNDADYDYSGEGSDYVDYDTYGCAESTCDWIECEAHEYVSEECWKELCTGCGSDEAC